MDTPCALCSSMELGQDEALSKPLLSRRLSPGQTTPMSLPLTFQVVLAVDAGFAAGRSFS